GSGGSANDAASSKCLVCGGTGRCSGCNGRARIYVTGYGYTAGEYVDCSACSGTGQCTRCNGTGR
ncbi:MAG: hypothetical protein Q4E18_15210, partial [Clostridia bacterium]|nr:hypothetical protein [Clostridia bacterium]